MATLNSQIIFNFGMELGKRTINVNRPQETFSINIWRAKIGKFNYKLGLLGMVFKC